VRHLQAPSDLLRARKLTCYLCCLALALRHNCNAGFIVNPALRGSRIGSALGMAYLIYAPKLFVLILLA
jgi:hypothetical protein